MIVFLSAVMLFTASSCSSVIFGFSNGSPVVMSCGKETLNESELRLIALHYKSAFEHYYVNLFGDDFWELPAEEGMTYGQYVRSYWILSECRALMSLCCMAEDNRVSLTDSEIESLERTAEIVFRELSEDERAFTNAGYNDVLTLLEKIETASKMLDTLTENAKIDVNDEESRVADIALIRVGDPDVASEIRARLDLEENFLTLANAFSEEKQIYYSVAKGDLKEPLNSAVFSLAEGEESDVLICEGSYYLIRVISSYNSILSSRNRTSIALLRRYNAWEEENEAHLRQHPLRMVPKMLENIPLTDSSYEVDFDLFGYLE